MTPSIKQALIQAPKSKVARISIEIIWNYQKNNTFNPSS